MRFCLCSTITSHCFPAHRKSPVSPGETLKSDSNFTGIIWHLCVLSLSNSIQLRYIIQIRINLVFQAHGINIKPTLSCNLVKSGLWISFNPIWECNFSQKTQRLVLVIVNNWTAAYAKDRHFPALFLCPLPWWFVSVNNLISFIGKFCLSSWGLAIVTVSWRKQRLCRSIYEGTVPLSQDHYRRRKWA